MASLEVVRPSSEPVTQLCDVDADLLLLLRTFCVLASSNGAGKGLKKDADVWACDSRLEAFRRERISNSDSPGLAFHCGGSRVNFIRRWDLFFSGLTTVDKIMTLIYGHWTVRQWIPRISEIGRVQLSLEFFALLSIVCETPNHLYYSPWI